MRHVLIDEYQDFSELFHRLMMAVREQNPQARFFCVGDDWQAINGFAGSDLRFFQDFTQYFPDSRMLHVATNYRSGKSIVNVGNALMKGSGKPARAHKKMTGKRTDCRPCRPLNQLCERNEEHPGDHFTPAVLRLVNKAVSRATKTLSYCLPVKISLPWYIDYKGSGVIHQLKVASTRFLAMVRASSVLRNTRQKSLHQRSIATKGLATGCRGIVLDAVQHCFPLLHSELIFTRIFGDNLEKVTAEERRLFYVALTRAVEDLLILTETGDVSPFLEDLEKYIRLSKLKWSDYPPAGG